MGRYEPDLTPSPDLAYVAGFYIGDGKSAGNEHKVRFELADKEQLELVGGLVAKILGRESKRFTRDGTFYVVDYDSVVLSDYLNQEVEQLLSHLSKYAADFIRGFADAEGYVSAGIDYSLHRLSVVMVGLVNTNIRYLTAIQNLLSASGIRSSVHRTNKKGGLMTIRGKTFVRRHDVLHLLIRGFSQVRRFSERVGFSNSVKSEKLEDILALEKMTPGDRYAWFTTHYHKEGRKWVKNGK